MTRQDDTLNNNESNTNAQPNSSESDDLGSKAEFEKIVYTNFAVRGVDLNVKTIPEDFVLLSSNSLLESYRVDDETCKKFKFEGETFDIVKKMSYEKKYTDLINIDSDYADRSFYSSDKFDVILGDATDTLYMFYMDQRLLSDADDAKLEEKDIVKIVDDFKAEYSLGNISDAFVRSYCRNNDKHEINYVLNIGGYPVIDETVRFSVYKNGDITFYSDDRTGLYDKYLDTVDKADIDAAVERMNRCGNEADKYGELDPYLQLGNDGYLYVCTAYFVDEVAPNGETIAVERMLYARVEC